MKTKTENKAVTNETVTYEYDSWGNILNNGVKGTVLMTQNTAGTVLAV